MDKETLSNYGWIVICVLVLAVMIALAGPFGTFVAGAVKSTTAGLFGVNQNALGAAGIEIGDQAFANCEHLETEIRNATADYSGDTCCKECGTILSTGTYVIPEGGKYYVGVTSTNAGSYSGATAIYTAGQAFPETVNDGDVYVYGNYEYKYNALHDVVWKIRPEGNGWGVRCIKNVAEPGPILEYINGKPITVMQGTFNGMSNMTKAPQIPETVINMMSTFSGCKNLKSDIRIPSNIKCDTHAESVFLYWAFYGCTSQTGTISLPCSIYGKHSDIPSECPATITYYHIDGCNGSCGH